MGIHLLPPLYLTVMTPPLPPPTTIWIYSDRGEGGNGVDGFVYRYVAGASWANIHDGDGNGFIILQSTDWVWIQSRYAAAPWQRITRMVQTFNSALIPDDVTILSARLREWGDGLTNTFGYPWAINVYRATLVRDNYLQASDYNTLGTTPLSTAIPDSQWKVGDYNYFPLNAAGLAYIKKQGFTNLALREAYYDAPNIEPLWLSWKSIEFTMRATETGETPFRPCLEVTYQ